MCLLSTVSCSESKEPHVCGCHPLRDAGDSRCSAQLRPGHSLPPPLIHPPGVGANSFCRMLQSGGKLLRMDRTRRPSAPLLCFVSLFSNVKRLRAASGIISKPNHLAKHVHFKIHSNHSVIGNSPGFGIGAGSYFETTFSNIII